MKISTILTIIVVLVLLQVFQLNAEDENGRLYVTSFEELPLAGLKTYQDGPVTWQASGRAEITDKYHKKGSRALHIHGGTENTVELTLEGRARECRGMTFQAERWTSRDPFKFRIDIRRGDAWQEIADLDKLVKVGRSFKSHIVIGIPKGPKAEALRMVCTAPEDTGVLIDDLELLSEIPENITRPPEVATEIIAKLLVDKPLFISGTEDTHTFRIPALITAPNGDLIACCDARRKSGADLIHVRDIDIVLKRSSDNGETWTDMETVCDYGDGRPASDPSFILDRKTEEIFCFYNYMDQDDAPKEFRLYVQSSRDNGKTWGKACDITDQIALPEWKMDFKFITSGRGIQTSRGDLLHCMVNLKNGMRVFGSKDHGKTWFMIDTPVKPANESKIVELSDGRLMVNARQNGRDFRWVHRSEDYGQTWVSEEEEQLVDPGCNGSIIRYTSKEDGYRKNRLLFSNANSFSGRKNLSVRISYDEGKTWSKGKVIDPGPSAYSSLTICKDGTIGVLYEPGYKEVRFARFTLEDLTDGEDSLMKFHR